MPVDLGGVDLLSGQWTSAGPEPATLKLDRAGNQWNGVVTVYVDEPNQAVRGLSGQGRTLISLGFDESRRYAGYITGRDFNGIGTCLRVQFDGRELELQGGTGPAYPPLRFSKSTDGVDLYVGQTSHEAENGRAYIFAETPGFGQGPGLSFSILIQNKGRAYAAGGSFQFTISGDVSAFMNFLGATVIVRKPSSFVCPEGVLAGAFQCTFGELAPGFTGHLVVTSRWDTKDAEAGGEMAEGSWSISASGDVDTSNNSLRITAIRCTQASKDPECVKRRARR